MTILPENEILDADVSELNTRVELVNKAAGSVKWSTLASLVPRLITPFSTIILAALLTPEDFGVVALSTLVVTLAQILAGMGMAHAVIQRSSGDVEEAATNAFWLNVILGLSLYFGVLWLSPGLAETFQSPILGRVLPVSGLALPLFTLGSVPHALLLRELNFRRVFWLSFALLVVSAVVSVALAFLGAGLWALVIGSLAGTVASIAVAWFSVRWRPVFRMDWAVTRSLLGFGVWSLVTGFQTWLLSYGDNALAGLFLGAAGVGVYAMGFTFAGLLPGFANSVVTTVAYPAFCELHRRGEALGGTLMQLQEMMAVLLFPLAFGVSAVADGAITLLYGDRWSGLGMVIAWLAVLPGLFNLWGLNGEAYRAMGRPDIWAKLVGAGLVFMFPLLWFAGPLGLMPFTVARFAGAALLPVLNILVTARVLGVPVLRQMRVYSVPFLASLAMFAAVGVFLRARAPLAGWTGWLTLLASILLGAAIYGGLVWWLRRDAVLQVIRMARRAMAGG